MSKPVSYKRHRFPPEIIAHAVWLYFRFPLSLRLVEEVLLERGIVFALTRFARPLPVGLPPSEERALTHRHLDFYIDGLCARKGHPPGDS